MINQFLKEYLKKIWHQAANYNNQILISLIKPSSKILSILDIGSFRGELVLERFAKVKKSKIYAIDINSDAVLSCKKLKIKAIQYNIENGLPYKSDFFDIVSANQIIEHLVDIDLFLQEIHRVLKPKGYLLLSTENLSSWHNIFALVLGWQAFSQHISFKKYIGNPMRVLSEKTEGDRDIHNKIFTLKGLVEICEVYGLCVEKTFGAGYYPFPKSISRFFSKIDPVHSAFIGLRAIKK